MKKMLAVVAGAAIVVPLSILTTPAAADIAPNGQIAYAYSEFCCDSDIWVMEADGSNPRNITNTPDVIEWNPSWSPDASKLAYNRSESEFDFGANIWVMDADGANQTNLTNNVDTEQYAPDWSADGTQIAFFRYVDGEVISSQSDIFVMNADGSNLTNITNSDTEELEPAWSPDGDRLVFSATRVPEGERFSYWEIVTSDPDGTDEVILTTPGRPGYEDRAPQWSPDGEMITWMAQENEPCCEDWDIWAMNEDGSGQTSLTDFGGDPYADMFPTWSPDGTEILFQSNRASGFYMDLFSVTAPTVLPPPAAVDAAPRFRQLTEGGGEDGDWAPGDEVRAQLAVFLGGKGSGGVRSGAATPGIVCGTDCVQDYAAGTTVRLVAKAAPGSVFAGWRGACTGTATVCRVTVGPQTQVGAVFKLQR